MTSHRRTICTLALCAALAFPVALQAQGMFARDTPKGAGAKMWQERKA